MPLCARRLLIDENRVGTYQCSSQCVRRSSFRDRTVGGLDLEHRRNWFYKRCEDLATIFSIQVCDAIAIDNQFHLNLRNRPDLAAKLSDREVVERWLRLSSKRLDLKPEAKQKRIEKYLSKRDWIAERRRRLSSISWFMRMLKEPIAREANAEDGVRGHFFGERFDSFNLEDLEQILIASLHINALEVNNGLADNVNAARLKSGGCPVQEGSNQPVAVADEAVVAERVSEMNAQDATGVLGATADRGSTADRGVAADRSAAVESSGERNVERTSSSEAAIETCGGDVGSEDGASLRHRLPIEDYCAWLAKHVQPRKPGSSAATSELCASGAGKRRGVDPGIAALVAPTLEVPQQLPSGWEKFGLDSERWAEAVPLIAHRFRRYAYRAAALRLDCKRLTASSAG